jgi:hypothetical protein
VTEVRSTIRVHRDAAHERANEIKALFRRNGQEWFDRVYDNSYPLCGAVSWVGEDEGSNIVMHVALFPCVITHGKHAWRSALLGDLLADKRHRTFFGPVRLMRRVVGDARADGFQLLYSDPTPLAAGVLKAAGFTRLGLLRRHALPTALPLRMYGMVRGARSLRLASTRPVDDHEVYLELTKMVRDGPVRVKRERDATIGRCLSAVDNTRWLWMESRRSPIKLEALVLATTHPDSRRVTIMDVAWGRTSGSVADALLTTANWAADAGYRWLDFSILENTEAVRSVRRMGFVARADSQLMMLQSLVTPRIVVPYAEWFLNRLDGSAW